VLLPLPFGLARAQHVDLQGSYLCGDLMIKGLTEQYPELTTFFEAEIIGVHHAFITGKWEASEKVDLQHWVRMGVLPDIQDIQYPPPQLPRLGSLAYASQRPANRFCSWEE